VGVGSHACHLVRASKDRARSHCSDQTDDEKDDSEMTSSGGCHRNDIGRTLPKLTRFADTEGMAKGVLGQPSWTKESARNARRFLLTVVILLALATPARAGLGDLVGGLLDPAAEPVDPLAGVVDAALDLPVVDPVVETVLTPVVEEVVEPVVEEIIAPIVEEVVPPIIDVVTDPGIDPLPEIIPPPEVPPVVPAVGVPPGSGTLPPSGSPQLDLGSSPGLFSSDVTLEINNDYEGALVLARSMQSALADPITVSLVSERSSSMESSGGWLTGLTGWLRAVAEGLLSVLAFPIRLLELLWRAMFSAGSGLVAPISLLVAYTVSALRERRLPELAS
jgi:hypothetical protein